MRSTWLSLGLAFTRFRYLTDFQETCNCNSCFVTIPPSLPHNIQEITTQYSREYTILTIFIQYHTIFKRNTTTWPTDKQ